MNCDGRIEKTLNRAGQTISDLPKAYSYDQMIKAAETMTAYLAKLYPDDPIRDEPENFLWFILHLTDIIDRMEWALENQVTLHENLMHVIGNADIPEGVSYDQFCLVVDSIYKAVQTAQEGWENYEDGVPKDGSVDDE